MKKIYALLLFMSINLHAGLPTLEQIKQYITHAKPSTQNTTPSQIENQTAEDQEVLSPWQARILASIFFVNIAGIIADMVIMKSHESNISPAEITQTTLRALIIVGYIFSSL